MDFSLFSTSESDISDEAMLWEHQANKEYQAKAKKAERIFFRKRTQEY